MKSNKLIMWVLRIIPAFILIQTLYFKFTAHPASVKLFELLGAEPLGRLGIGALELVAGLLLLLPKSTKYGALLAVGLMIGAIGSHLFVLGIEYNNDGGALFGMAVVTFVTSAVLLWIYRYEIIDLIRRIAGKNK